LVPKLGRIAFRRDALGNALVAPVNPPTSGSELRAPSNVESASNNIDTVIWLQLRRSEPKSMHIPWNQWRQGTSLVLDGYEQLWPWQQLAVVMIAKLRCKSVLITSHGRTLLPTLHSMQMTPELAAKVIEYLVRDVPGFPKPSCQELQASLKRLHGNLRELLLTLYDQFEEL
jgi:hypothetical protein